MKGFNTPAIGLAITLSLFIIAHSRAQTPDEQKTGGSSMSHYELLAEGAYSAIEEPRQAVLRESGALGTLWAAHSAHLSPAPAPPVVDFASHTVVAVFAGNQPTGGHALAVSGLEKAPGGWVLRVALVKPAPDCMVTQVITQPWLLVSLPGRDLAVTVKIAESARPCGP